MRRLFILVLLLSLRSRLPMLIQRIQMITMLLVLSHPKWVNKYLQGQNLMPNPFLSHSIFTPKQIPHILSIHLIQLKLKLLLLEVRKLVLSWTILPTALQARLMLSLKDSKDLLLRMSMWVCWIHSQTIIITLKKTLNSMFRTSSSLKILMSRCSQCRRF
jgi:hypothetical protein